MRYRNKTTGEIVEAVVVDAVVLFRYKNPYPELPELGITYETSLDNFHAQYEPVTEDE